MYLMTFVRLNFFLERVLEIKFAAKDSAYHGAYFISGDHSGEHLLLKKSIDPIDGELVEPMYGQYAVLLYANEVEQNSSLESRIATEGGFILLRREEI